MSTRRPIFPVVLASIIAPHLVTGAEFGTLKVAQLANNNNTLASAGPGISLALGPGSSSGGSFLSTANRGDYNMDFGRLSDTGAGILLSSAAQLLRNDSASGGPAPGDFNATSSFGIDGANSKYWIAVHWAEVADNAEANIDVSYAYLPYDELPGGFAINSANNGELTAFTGTEGLSLGVHLVDPPENNGQYTLNLSPLAADASQTGILLVTGAKNEDNYALSRANGDGTFTLFCHDNGSNGGSYENDGVGFSYLASSAVGTNRLVAIGRVNGDGSTDVAAGDFTVAKGPTGRWDLRIPGHSAETGTLIVSPEGGGSNNIDNIVAAEWDAANSRWIIESRDLNGNSPQTPALQNMANAAEDAFSFAFFALDPGNRPPSISLRTPADESLKVPVDAPLSAATTDPDGDELTVKFFGRRVAAVEPADEFSVVALPDTQFYSENTGGDLAAIFSAQTDWIVAEREARNIGFVLHLGDITQRGDNPSTAPAEWANAANAMYRLENPSTTMLEEGVPYILAVGNHDQTPIGDADGTTVYFNTYFGVHPETGINHFAGKSYYGGTSEPAKADNNYTLFTAGGIDFIVISLEYDTTPDAGDLEWADALLKAHPARRGIVITHYMVGTGNPANFSTQGAAIHEALKDNPNLILMHGGHIHGEGRRSDTYQDRTVHSLLADYQGRSRGGDGWLRIMRFRPSLNRMEVQTYSPVLDRFETDEDSRFSLTVNLRGGMGPFTEIGSTSGTPGNAAVTWEGLEPGTRYEWYATVSDGSATETTPLRSFVTDGVPFAPVVELTSPANGSIHASPASIQLEASASDIDGTVAKVRFFSGTTLIGEDDTAPYSVTWEGVPTGSYIVIAKAIDDEGNTGAAAPAGLQVVTEPAAPDPSTASTGLFNAGWSVAAGSSAPRQFTHPGGNTGDLELKINGTAPSFLSGITAVANWENPGNSGVDSIDNLYSAYASGSGKAWINLLDNANPNAADANPATVEESAGMAVSFLPYASGWVGASVGGSGQILGGNLPEGVTVTNQGKGIYYVSGLALAGNFLAFPNGGSGTDADNVVSVRQESGNWWVEVRDNAGNGQNASFSFLYVPASTPEVLSGMILKNGSVAALNGKLAAMGADASKKAGYFEITFGDGSGINPSNSALFLTGDSGPDSHAADNIASYSAAGNAFRVFSQDLPQLSGSFQATDIRFLAVPFDFLAQQPPAVSLEATDALGGEYGEDRGLAFTFTRSGPAGAAITVAYATGGTATPGTDYTALSGVLEIPSGQSSAAVTVEILPDSAAEGDETLSLALIDGDLYDRAEPAAATATIKDRPLQAYLHAAGEFSPEADGDGDGIPNILEYYLGSSASGPAGRGTLSALPRQDGSFAARFPRARSASDLSAVLEWSADLLEWHRSGASDGIRTANIETRTVSQAGVDPETVEALLTFSSGPVPARVFLRLSVTP